MVEQKIITPALNLPKVIGHRGACGYVPENTLLSMRKAFELGAEWVEFDVMLTADDEAIIMHDDTLDHTTNGKGPVAAMKLTDLKKLDAGSWFKPEFAGEKIPTFIELLTCLNELNLGMNIEIKPTPGRDIETAKKVIEILTKQSLAERNNLIISSFSIASLYTARQLNPYLNLGLLLHEWVPNWQRALDELNCISFHANHEILTPAIVQSVKATGRYVLAYTVNDAWRAQELFSWGVDAIFTDFLDQMIRIVKS